MSSAATPDRLQSVGKTASVWLFVATLAWAPFPLGGAIAWAAGLQEILIALCWLMWTASSIGTEEWDWREWRVVAVPLALVVLVLCWAIIQIIPNVYSVWAHPVWAMAADTLHTPLPAMISLNPWRTETELLKLASYVMTGWLAFRMGQRVETAKLLLNGVIAIGAAYAIYAFLLAFADVQQVNVFYAVPYKNPLMSGPFMLHNSFATFSGLAAVAAVAKLVTDGGRVIQSGRGSRRLIETIVRYCFGTGAIIVIAVLLTFAGVVASASRAGFAATMCGLTAIAVLALATTRGQSSRFWAGMGAVAAALPIMIILIFNGDTLGSRVDQLLASDTADAIRFALWASARRMISDAPFLGLGLGTFEDAYPLYAAQIYPHVMDKTHCDYLEFAAGVGLPAAIAWWTALIWLCGLCIRGVFIRHRNRVYPVVAVGASALVGVHSSVDFSLQLPAVALFYATLMGIGVAQCLPNSHRQASQHKL